jgi:hypothetical protein
MKTRSRDLFGAATAVDGNPPSPLPPFGFNGSHFVRLVHTALGLLGVAASVHAAPRPPLPPWPEQVLGRWSFDDALISGTEAPVLWDGTFGPYVESWNGYALRRSGSTQWPLSLPTVLADGPAQVPLTQGTIRFWFRPDWSSRTLGGTGPGTPARLLQMDCPQPDLGWALSLYPDGNGLFLTAHAGKEEADWLWAPIQWRARQWHLVSVTYSAEGMELFVDWERVAVGPGWSWGTLQQSPILTVGSDRQGLNLAQGEFDELVTLDRPIEPEHLLGYYRGHWRQAGLGPVVSWEAEWARISGEALAAEEDGGLVVVSEGGEGEGDGPPEPPGGGGEPPPQPDYGPPGWTLGQLALLPPVFANGSNAWLTATNTTAGAQYDLFAITNLVSTNWWWLTRGGINQTNFSVSSLPEEQCYFILGTMQDNDGDGLTDAYENLVSHTSPGSWTSADSDGDGMPDAWELAQGTHPQLVDGGEDRDGDGATNLQEYRAGTSAGLAEAWAVWVGRPSGRSSVP